MPLEFLDGVQASIFKAQDSYRKRLEAGTILSFDEYKNVQGKLAGLKEAVEILKERKRAFIEGKEIFDGGAT